MKTYCIDTNSILDICYRYYPPTMFGDIWEQIEGHILSKHVQFVISEHIHSEVYDKVKLMGFNKSTLDNFLNKFQVRIIPIADYQVQLSELQAELLEITPLSSSIGRNADDLSNVCVAKILFATVITSEQGSKLKITDSGYRRLKIPDTCDHYGIQCSNWLPVFAYMGIKY